MSKTEKLVLFFSLCAGIADSLTGALLLFLPDFTLGLMGISVATSATVFIRYIGVFVLAVGLSYAIGIWPAVSAGNWRELRTVWKMTTLARLLVCLFTTAAIAGGSLSVAWISVPLTDGAIAALQGGWLLAGKWPAGTGR